MTLTLWFVCRFTLQPDDPNYEAYADKVQGEENGEPIHYYIRCVHQLKIEEATTMYVDFHHLSSFNWEDPLFLDKLISEYGRFEPYLR